MSDDPTNAPGDQGSPDWEQAKDKLLGVTGADRMILVAGLVFFIDSFLPWYGVSFRGFGADISANVSGWSSGTLAVLAIIAAILATVFAAMRVLGAKLDLGGIKDGTVYLGLGAAAFLFALLRWLTETNFTKYGLFVAIIAGAVLAYGGYLKNQQTS